MATLWRNSDTSMHNLHFINLGFVIRLAELKATNAIFQTLLPSLQIKHYLNFVPYLHHKIQNLL